ncbi:MAG: hypothetical protein EXR79_00855 [Myxococcales bacterium]|nr:hypothetical protein [Myxococcales bacterium]
MPPIRWVRIASRAAALTWTGLACATCGDAAMPAASKADAVADAGGPGADAALAADTAATDAVPDVAANLPPDTTGSAGDGTGSDSSPADSGTGDAGPLDAAADSPDAGPPALVCAKCPFDEQPLPPHPGSPGKYSSLSEPLEIAYGSGFGQGYKSVLIVKPFAPGPFPVLFFVPGKQLATGGGLVQKLGHPYLDFLEHVASHGYIAAFVRVEAGLIDADHERMADDLLAAMKVTLKDVNAADPTKVALAGHSMGAKVALIAAWKILNLDLKGEYPMPAAALLFALANEPPPIGGYYDACAKAKEIVPAAPTWFTFVQADDDTTATHKDPKKPNANGCYAALQTQKKQIIVLHGTGPGDKNPPTDPELHDDHSAPLSIVGKPGGLADFATTDSYLDALDWYGYWKLTVGALDFHWKGGAKAWAYGDLRTHGGTAKNGGVIQHEVLGQGWP